MYSLWRVRVTIITYSECVCVCVCVRVRSLGYPACKAHAFSSVACTALPYFYTLSHKRYDFRKKRLLNIKYVFQFS